MRRRQYIIATAAILLPLFTAPPTLAAPPASQPFPPDIASLLEPLRKSHDLPALGGAIVTSDGLEALGAVGVRKKGADAKVTPADQWHLGSDTKSMTATVLAMLVEEGKLTWSTTLADVFPDLADKMHADYRTVTLEQLLTHRAGCPANFTDADALWKQFEKEKTPLPEQRRILLDRVVTSPPAHKPGTKFLYSNVGYTLAGAMAEKLLDKPWEEIITVRLFKPLGMSSAGFGAPGDKDKLDQPWGHSKGLLGVKPVPPGPDADNEPAIAPAGTVRCSLADWAKYIAFHLRGCKGDTPLLKQASFKKLHTPPEGAEYACGWGVLDRPWGGRVLTHAGSNTMWFCVVWMSPARDFAVLATCNQGGADQPCDQVASALIQQHFNSEALKAAGK